MGTKPHDISEDAWRLLKLLAAATELRFGPYRLKDDVPSKSVRYGWIMNNSTIVATPLIEQLMLGGYLCGPADPPSKIVTEAGKLALQEAA